MKPEYLDKIKELNDKEEPYVLATVIDIEGSASAKPGSKAIFDAEGNQLLGWVGGGCSVSETGQAAIKAIKSEKSRIITVDLDDEVLSGMPCGGSMQIYVEPYIPSPELLILGHGQIAETIAKMGSILNFAITINDSMATKEAFPTADKITNIGFSDLAINENTYVIVATQHKGDHLSLKKALKSDSPYIALIASQKRTELTFKYLIDMEVSEEDLRRIRAPAGLDLGGITPEEIALSVISEIVSVRRGGTYQPLTVVKQIDIQKISAD